MAESRPKWGAMKITANRLSIALEVLAQLSARTDDGALRDEVSHVRDALWDWREDLSLRPGQETP